MSRTPRAYIHEGQHFWNYMRDVIPPPPEVAEPIPCQWGQLTTRGPAIEWPQDEYHRGVLQIGVQCDRPATNYATYDCPDRRFPSPHDHYLICHHHAMYSYPIWKSDDPPGLHGVTSGKLHQATPEWRDWLQAHAARNHHAGETAGPHALVLQPALF